MNFKSVDWAIIGCGIFGFLFLMSSMFSSMFIFGFALGWAACGIFWTYWIQYHGKKEDSTT